MLCHAYLNKRNDLVIKAADKGGATVVWCTDLYQKEAIRQLSDPTFYNKVNKDVTSANQKIVKDTIQELITKQERPVTAENLIIAITTPRISYIYFKPKIHKPKYPGRPIVSACSCLSELISLTNTFHVAVRLFSNRSQMTSKCGKNKSGTRGASEFVTDVLTTF